MDTTSEILRQFTPITLVDMDSVTLMDRIDIKYLLSSNQLKDILKSISSSYFVMEELGIRQFLYRNIYFDTADKQLYLSHHNGKSLRYKLRIREYCEFHRIFLEVKKKFKGRTVKSRFLLSDNSSIEQFSDLKELPVDAIDFLKNNIPVHLENLIESMKNEFLRITLIHKDMQERITIDINLNFISPGTKQNSQALPAVVIVEIKKNGYSGNHPFRVELKSRGMRPNSMSKYCIGSISLFPEIKYNYFKKTNLTIERITHAGI